MRCKHLLKGIFLYNTIYWRRASDDLDIHHMDREERASLRPKRNLEIIRPRERPRPPVDVNAVLSLPPEYGERQEISPPISTAATVPPPVDLEAQEGYEIHRRKKRRRGRHSKLLPKRYYEPDSSPPTGILGWLFKR